MPHSNASLRGERLIFIGGAPRSGTTLLQGMLDSHPIIFGGPEFDFTPAIANLRNQLSNAATSGRIQAFVDPAQIDIAVAAFLEHLLLPAAERHGKTHVSEKTPMNVLVFPTLLELFPGARFIHMVRDPRAVALSMIQVAERYRQQDRQPPAMIANPGQVVQTLLQHVKAGADAAAQAPERVFTLRYEDLVQDPGHSTRALCDFLSIEWSPRMLAPQDQAHEAEAQLIADGGLWATDTRLRAPDPARLNQWQQNLTPALLEELTQVFLSLPLYATLGYDFDASPTTLSRTTITPGSHPRFSWQDVEKM